MTNLKKIKKIGIILYKYDKDKLVFDKYFILNDNQETREYIRQYKKENGDSSIHIVTDDFLIDCLIRNENTDIINQYIESTSGLLLSITEEIQENFKLFSIKINMLENLIDESKNK